MTKLDSLFLEFLSNINPEPDAINNSIAAHKPVREFLEKDEDFGQHFIDSFLYGSYRRNTAVGSIKDVDIIILTNFDLDNDNHTPAYVLKQLKNSLARYYKDPENPEYQRRSIRINKPLPDNNGFDMTLDIVPAIIVDGTDEPLKIPDREVMEWIWSHPKGHIRHTSELNTEASSEGRFIPLVKIMKWWWKYQCAEKQPTIEKPKPKGFWLEVLTGENFDAAQHFYADHFVAVLENIYAKYSNIGKVPDLQDPGLPNVQIDTNMTLEEFGFFMEVVKESLDLAKAARDEVDDKVSSEIWRNIFGGQEFPILTDNKETKQITMPLGDSSHAIRPNWQLIHGSRYTASIHASMCDSTTKKFLRPLRNDGEILQPNQLIKFFAETDVKGDFEIFWQVVNTGEHARSQGGLRGDKFFRGTEPDNITLSPDQKHNYERTLYTGKHWIQCFVIQRDKCVAKSDRFYVNIINPDYPIL